MGIRGTGIYHSCLMRRKSGCKEEHLLPCQLFLAGIVGAQVILK